jgi:DNA-binding XRE family transcriptional regulator
MATCKACNGRFNLTDKGGNPRYVCSRCKREVPLEVVGKRDAELDQLRWEMKIAYERMAQSKEVARRAMSGVNVDEDRPVVTLGFALAELLAARAVAKPEQVDELKRIAKG